MKEDEILTRRTPLPKLEADTYRNVSEHGIEMINGRFLQPKEVAGKEMFGGRFEFYTKIGAIEKVK